jgi:hypothetical protein
LVLLIVLAYQPGIDLWYFSGSSSISGFGLQKHIQAQQHHHVEVIDVYPDK